MTRALVIGGGPAGSALAAKLARAGHEVVLVERDSAATHKVCGEFLSHEAAVYCGSLGVDLIALGAVRIDRVRFMTGARAVEMPLPFRALGLSRFVFDDALLRAAEANGAEVRRGTKVVALERRESCWRARTAGGSVVDAEDVFLATGKHDLRDFKRPRGLQDDLVAFKQHFRLSPGQTRALAGAVELFTFDGGYAGLSLVEDGVANLCLVVRRSRFAAVGRSWDALLVTLTGEAPLLGERLAGATSTWLKPLSLSFIPYGHVRRRTDGTWRLGDQAAVIPSFSGDGMSIALHSAELAAGAFARGERPAAFQRMLARDVRSQMLLAIALSHGLVHGGSQRAFGAVARAFPSVLAKVAFRTRISDRALARATA